MADSGKLSYYIVSDDRKIFLKITLDVITFMLTNKRPTLKNYENPVFIITDTSADKPTAKLFRIEGTADQFKDYFGDIIPTHVSQINLRGNIVLPVKSSYLAKNSGNHDFLRSFEYHMSVSKQFNFGISESSVSSQRRNCDSVGFYTPLQAPYKTDSPGFPVSGIPLPTNALPIESYSPQGTPFEMPVGWENLEKHSSPVLPTVRDGDRHHELQARVTKKDENWRTLSLASRGDNSHTVQKRTTQHADHDARVPRTGRLAGRVAFPSWNRNHRSPKRRTPISNRLGYYLPFYTGVNGDEEVAMSKAMTVQTSGDLRRKYCSMGKEFREQADIVLQQKFDIPSRCEYCHKSFNGNSYIGHVLSYSHIMKSWDCGIRYSRVNDFEEMEDLFERTEECLNSER